MKAIIQSTVTAAMLLICGLTSAEESALWVELRAERAQITALGWDAEGTRREKTNLLRPGTSVGLRIRGAGRWHGGIALPTRCEADARGRKSYWITVAPETEVNWQIRSFDGGLTARSINIATLLLTQNEECGTNRPP